MSMAMCTDKQEVLSRFDGIEESLNALRKMINEDQLCLDLLCQIYTVCKAIEQLEADLVDHEFSACMHVGFGGEKEEAIITELVQLYRLVGNR